MCKGKFKSGYYPSFTAAVGQEETKNELSSATSSCTHCWFLVFLIKDKAGKHIYLMTSASFLLTWQWYLLVSFTTSLSVVESHLLPTLGPYGM